MLKNYLLGQLRNFNRQKFQYLLNIFGLTLGLASTVFILLWIVDESSYEKMHTKAKDIFLVHKSFTIGDELQVSSALPMALAPSLKDNFPEVQNSVRVVRQSGVISIEDESFIERRIAATDPSFFELFTYHFQAGSSMNALSDPYSMVITQEIAEKYFGEEDPIGQSVILNDSETFTVTGVVRNLEGNSLLNYDLFVPFTTLFIPGGDDDSWYDHFTSTYLYMPSEFRIDSLNARLTRHIRSFMTSESSIELILQSVKNTYLHDLSSNNQRSAYIYIFSVIGIMIIVIACINYTNASTYISLRRSKEIGVKKIIGATKRQLMRQFLHETIFQSVVAYMLAMILVELLHPQFNNLTGKSITIPYFEPYFIFSSIGIVVFTALLAGIYPSLLISSFQPIEAFRGSVRSGKEKSLLRAGLLVFQFAVSTGLIISSLSIFKQVRYMQETDLGFDKENLIYLPYDEQQGKSYDVFKAEILKESSVTHLCRTSSLPTSVWNIVRGLTWEGKKDDEAVAFAFIAGDEDLAETLGLEIIEGRDFDKNFSSDSSKVVLNEMACDAIGYEYPVGKYLMSDSTPIEILGKFGNFHSLPLTYKMEPLMITFWEEFYSYFLIRIKPDDQENTVAYIRNTWEELYPTIPFNCNFLDERIRRQYLSESRIGKLTGVFTILAVMISCIGLFAVAGLMIQSRVKEIGIRKVLGASVASVRKLFSFRYIIWIILSNILAWPLAYLFVNEWMNNFAYRQDIGVSIFIVALLFSLLITILTVSWHIETIARINPAETLRGE